MDPKTSAALDQAAAHLRDGFDELGITADNPEHVRVLRAVIILFQAAGSTELVDPRWYGLLFARFLGWA